MTAHAPANVHPGVSGEVRGFLLHGFLWTVRGALCLPTLALLVVFSLVVRIRIARGFWPFFGPFEEVTALEPWPSAFGSPVCCASHIFHDHALIAFLCVLAGFMAALSAPVLITVQWKLEGRRRSGLVLTLLVSTALLAHVVFGDTNGWGEWFFD